MIRQIDRDTQLCISLSARPGNFGNRFHNFLYGELGLNFINKSFKTENLEDSIRGVRALGIRGCALSMPFKEQVLPLLDEIDPTARRIGSVNTIVNTDGRLKGFNTDYLAIRDLVKGASGTGRPRTVVFGSGGMARAVAFALSDLGLPEVTIIARNRETGESLAADTRFRWLPGLEAYRQSEAELPELLINASPVGMAGGSPEAAEASPFPRPWIEGARIVLDSVAIPIETPLIRQARESGKTVITGFDVSVIQGKAQFALYTGVEPDAELVEKAARIAKG